VCMYPRARAQAVVPSDPVFAWFKRRLVQIGHRTTMEKLQSQR
jgi:hypothetical protein